MTSKLWRTAARLAIAMALAVGLCRSAAHAASPRSNTVTPAAPQAAPASGSMVAVDAMGKIRQPTREEAQALIREVEKMFAVSAAAASVTTWPDGTLSAELPEGYGNLYLARLDADGSIGSACVENAAAAAAFLDGAAALEEK